MSRVYPRVCGGATRPFRRARHEPGLFPRVRGSRVSIRATISSWGLSPRVRGSPASFAPCGLGVRSIPACAGEPLNAGGVETVAWVYPRVCGGAVPPAEPTGYILGLSPRVRGSPMPEMRLTVHPGSIPACGGAPNSSPRRYRGPGLSPRVRGSPSPAGRHAGLLRSIPAHCCPTDFQMKAA